MNDVDLIIEPISPLVYLDVENNRDVTLDIQSSSGTSDYNLLSNKPSIEGVELQGDKTFPQLGMNTLSIQEIEKILYLN